MDTETGEVTVLSLKSAYEVGRALNPKMVEQQIVGGACHLGVEGGEQERPMGGGEDHRHAHGDHADRHHVGGADPEYRAEQHRIEAPSRLAPPGQGGDTGGERCGGDHPDHRVGAQDPGFARRLGFQYRQADEFFAGEAS